MKINISCQEASQLVSRQIDQQLSLMDSVRLRAHLLICKACPVMHRNLKAIHQAGLKYAFRDEAKGGGASGLSPEAKGRISGTLRQEKGDRDAERLKE
ncbi:MAG: hypothetical protein GC183_03230 [Thiobacillus sp.]|nr:hypothetical protein [Thiobacillus sp.]